MPPPTKTIGRVHKLGLRRKIKKKEGTHNLQITKQIKTKT